MENQRLDKFIDQLITDKKLSGLTKETRAIIANQIQNELTRQINRALVSALPDDKIDELDRIIDDPKTTRADIDHLVADAGVDVATITAGTLLQFRELYLGLDEKG